MLSVFGYSAASAPTKDIDGLFGFGLYSDSVTLSDATIGPVGLQVPPPTAMGGTIISGGGSGASAPAYIDAVYFTYL
jgi:beta-glucosidase